MGFSNTSNRSNSLNNYKRNNSVMQQQKGGVVMSQFGKNKECCILFSKILNNTILSLFVINFFFQ